MTRGPDFADELTPVQQQTLDRLLEQVRAKAAEAGVAGAAKFADATLAADDPPLEPVTAIVTPRRTRGSRLTVLLAAAAVAAIALAAGLAPILTAPTPAPTPAASATQMSTVDLFRRLAVAAAQAGPATTTRLDSVVVLSAQKGPICTTTTAQVVTELRPARGSSLATVSLDVYSLVQPDLAGDWLTCTPLTTSATGSPPRVLFSGTAGPSAEDFPRLLGKAGNVGVYQPDLPDPRTLPGSVNVAQLTDDRWLLATILDKSATAAGAGTGPQWWTAAAALFGSPSTTPAVRSAGFGLAADPVHAASARLVTDHPVDMLGRPGVTVRVPYQLGTRPATADLTFDLTTGRLLQRTVYQDAGTPTIVVITAYR